MTLLSKKMSFSILNCRWIFWQRKCPSVGSPTEQDLKRRTYKLNLKLSKRPFFKVNTFTSQRAPGSKPPTLKLLTRPWVESEYKIVICPWGQKLFHVINRTDIHTLAHRQAGWHTFCISLHPLRENCLIFYAWEDGKLQTLRKFYHFNSWRIRIGLLKNHRIRQLCSQLWCWKFDLRFDEGLLDEDVDESGSGNVELLDDVTVGNLGDDLRGDLARVRLHALALKPNSFLNKE